MVVTKQTATAGPSSHLLKVGSVPLIAADQKAALVMSYHFNLQYFQEVKLHGILPSKHSVNAIQARQPLHLYTSDVIGTAPVTQTLQQDPTSPLAQFHTDAQTEPIAAA